MSRLLRFCRLRAALVALLAPVAMSGCAQNETDRRDYADCMGHDTNRDWASRKFQACTSALDSGRLTAGQNAMVSLMRATANGALGNNQVALTEVNQVLGAGTYPHGTDMVIAVRGMVHEQMGDLMRAETDFKEASRLRPDNPNYLRALTRIQARLRNGGGDSAQAAAPVGTSLSGTYSCYTMTMGPGGFPSMTPAAKFTLQPNGVYQAGGDSGTYQSSGGQIEWLSGSMTRFVGRLAGGDIELHSGGRRMGVCKPGG